VTKVGPLKKDPHGREAHLYVFYVPGRLSGGSVSNRLGEFVRVLRVGEACVRFLEFYEGLKLWEAHLYVFYVSGRLWGGRPSNHAVTPSWSARDKPSPAWGEGELSGV